ncbi:MAG TPA: hypothetical protein VNN74_01895 [Candidatus Micrarchaeia archaeon]|nr:hypothetical protein [Candidatus Micrarchaeia archaeon]
MIAAAAAAIVAAAAAAGVTAWWPDRGLGALASGLGRLRLPGPIAWLGLVALTVLVAAVPALGGAHPTPLFVLAVVAALVGLGGAAALGRAWPGSGGRGR